MGLEARCKVTRNNDSWTASVHLDSAAIQIRGRPAIEVAFANIRRAKADRGKLVIETADQVLTLALGEAAETWARKITNPRSRIEKLGIKTGQTVILAGADDPDLVAELESVGAEIVAPTRRGVDAVFLAARTARDLARLVSLPAKIDPAGAIWVVRTKGKQAVVKESEVLDAAKAAGLVAIKVVAFSDTQSADKLVIPVAQRPAKKSKKP